MVKAKHLTELLARAGMDEYQYNTGVVRNTNSAELDFRIGVSPGVDAKWRDCITITVNNPKTLTDHTWTGAHFSPARARLIASHLLRVAEAIEAIEGVKKIDHEPRKHK